MKPLIKYRGGKSKEVTYIEKYIPQFTGRYVEPFFGGGALYFHLEPKSSIINDINSNLMNFYDGVKTYYPQLRIELDKIETEYENNRKEFEELKEKSPEKRVEDKNEQLYYSIRDMYNGLAPKKFSDALIYYFINKTAYSGMIRYNSKGEFNVPYGRYRHLNTELVTKQHNELLSKDAILNEDYKKVFNRLNKEDFVFLAPPYDCIFSDYGNSEYKDGFNGEAHEKLAKDFKDLPCKALMVIGRTSLTEKLYGNMVIDEYAKIYAVNIRNRFKSSATHILVANYKD